MPPHAATTTTSSLAVDDSSFGADDPSTQVVVIVDPYSTGCLVAQEISKRGYKILALWTKGFSPVMKTHVPLSCENLTYHAQVDEQAGSTLSETAAAVQAACKDKDDDDHCYTIVACLPGGEAGVDLADALSEWLRVRTNGTDIPNRRDKKIQQELIAAAGLRSVRQAGGDKFEDVREFLQTEEYPGRPKAGGIGGIGRSQAVPRFQRGPGAL